MPPASWSATARWNRRRLVVEVTIKNLGEGELGPFEVHANGDRRHVARVMAGEAGPTTSVSDPFAQVKVVTVELTPSDGEPEVLQVPVA